jgi:uncharacterized protein YjiS (DUF1127 family)
MKTILPTWPAPQIVISQSWTANVLTRLQHLWSAFLTPRLQRSAINQLNSLSHRQLKNNGLDRSEIIGAVRRPTTRGFRFARYY